MILYAHSVINADKDVSNIYRSVPATKLFLSWVYFIIDNSANGGICNIKSMFFGDFERHIVTLVAAYGRTTTVKLVGTIHIILKDDENKTWSYDIPDVVYDPESP